MKQKYPFIIGGMHRSGTSMLTRIVNLMGFTISEDLIPPQEDNVRGFWEDRELIVLNEEILTNIGSHHLDSAFMPKGWRHRAAVRIVTQKLYQKISVELQRSPTPWVLKDPRISRLLPVYNEVFEQLNVMPKMAIALRHPFEVANSLLKRNGIPIEHGLRTWLQYHLDCELYSRHMERTYVYYPYLLNDWRSQCERIARNTDVLWPKTYEEAAPHINKFIEPDLRHHDVDQQDFDLPPEISALFKHLHDVAEDKCDVNRDLLDSIYEQQYEKYLPTIKVDKHAKRICLITCDIIGPVKNGGVGTAFYHLAKALKDAGNHVTILYVGGNYAEQNTINSWVEWYRQQQIEFVPLVASNKIALAYMSKQAAINYQVYMWLKDQQFDALYCHEWLGCGFFVLQAREAGLAFTKTAICTVTHGPTIWHARYNQQGHTDSTSLEVNYMEKRTVELADFVVSPSQFMLDWMKGEGWKCPENVSVIQNLIDPDKDKNTTTTTRKRLVAGEVKEIVFFGRLETRKGVKLFIEALARVPIGLLERVVIHFMGKNSIINQKDSVEFIKEEMNRMVGAIKLSVKITTNYTSSQAQQYLKNPGCLAVIASLSENSPYTVREVINKNIPFIATNTGGIAELVHEDDREQVLYLPRPQLLAKKISEILSNGIEVARPAFANKEITSQWLDLNKNILKYQTELQKKKGAVKQKDRPLVTVCITHFERPQYLEKALASIASQSYPWMEIIVIDDGSQDKISIAYLNQLEESFVNKEGWTLVRQENSFMGAARNNAAKLAKGEYILFMDDDNIAMPNEVEVLVNVAEHTQADIVAPGRIFFRDERELSLPNALRTGWVPLGNALDVGVFKNAFGDNNALFKKTSFDKLGGYTEDYGIGFEDYELLVKASFDGYKIIGVPDPLYYYRRDEKSGITAGTSYIANRYRVMRLFKERYPELGATFDRIATVI